MTQDAQPTRTDRPSGGGGRPTRNGAEPGTEVLFLGGLGVTELARRVGREIQQDDCLGRAAQLAYYFLFALFPFFLVLITLLGYLPIPLGQKTQPHYFPRGYSRPMMRSLP